MDVAGSGRERPLIIDLAFKRTSIVVMKACQMCCSMAKQKAGLLTS